ncbi:DUF2637 domain-containing protein [Kitasatospora sp. NPDC004240]
MARPKLTGIHMFLIVIVAIASVTIAGIGFLGSYTAVRELAVQQGFGRFSTLFPIGIDVGILALLALDLLLSWLRIPFPLLRQTAWLLTAATIAMNAASAWPRPLGVGMHAVIPLLFVVIAEAGRHAISRLAKLTDSRRMESVRFMRWLLSPLRTFAMWRRMQLWELRSVDEAVRLEQLRLAYALLLEDEYGKDWNKTAPRSALLPLRLAKLGVPIYTTAGQGLAAAGLSDSAFGGLFSSAPSDLAAKETPTSPARIPSPSARPEVTAAPVSSPIPDENATQPAARIVSPRREDPDEVDAGPVATTPDPSVAERDGEDGADITEPGEVPVALEAASTSEPPGRDEPTEGDATSGVLTAPVKIETPSAPASLEDGQSREDQLYFFYCRYVERHGQYPEKHLFADFIYREFGQTGQSGTGPVSVQSLRRYWGNLEGRYRAERGAAPELLHTADR